MRLQLLPFQIKRFRLNRAPAESIDWLCRTLERAGAVFPSRVSFAVSDGKLNGEWH